MKKINVRSTSGTYEIWCGRGVAAQSARAVGRLAEQSALFLISSPRVWKHLGARIERIFKGVHRATILFDDREAAKNLSTVERTSRKLVIADPELLRTLPPREFRSGIYEIIKYGVIGDAKLFQFLELKMDTLLRRDPAALDFVIERSVSQKARVVSLDERESGLREILNFGHTFAHALESVTRYRKYLHGEAVGWGMIAATRMAVASGLLPAKDSGRILHLIARVGSLPRWPSASPARLIAAMQADKKTRAGRLRFVLPERIGKVCRGEEADPQILAQVMRECASSGSLK